MGKIIKMHLLDRCRTTLTSILRRGSDWRQRERAQTLLLLDKGLSTKEVAEIVGVHHRTVGSTRSAWLKDGMKSLPDLVRCGAPRKILPEQIEALVNLARAEPLSATDLLAKHLESGGTPVQLNTLSSALKSAGLVWKRTRHSLKKRRNEAAFRAAQVEIESLRRQAATGEILLAYLDEVGFSQVHPNRGAWTPVGECHLIEAKRGKRLNILGALLSTGDFFCAKLWQATTSEAFIGFLGFLKDKIKEIGKPLIVILDNASIHKAKAIQSLIDFLATQGVTLYFLPPYSPELNRIERLWHKAKHTWLLPKCRDAAALEADVDAIFDNFGTKYQFAF